MRTPNPSTRGVPLLLWALLMAPAPALAFPATMCPADRYGSNLGCTANDVSITSIAVAAGPAACTGGESITLDLNMAVNFATPNRWDIGIFISNDIRNPQLTVANGGATSCSVAILPITAPFLDLDGGGATPRDTCGDGNGSIGGGTGVGILRMDNVTVPCKATDTSGLLSIPFVVTWDNQASPTGKACRSIADPVPNTTSKCNAPDAGQGNVNVVVLPGITKSDGISLITPGMQTTYTIIVSNSTGITLSTANGNAAVFTDPAVSNLAVSNVTCSAAGGASCPVSSTVVGMQGAGLTIPSMPNNSSVTFSVTATVTGGAPADSSITNTARVTVKGQTNTASDSNTVVYPSLMHMKSVSIFSDPINGSTNPKFIPGAVADYTLRVTNSGQGSVQNDTLVITDPLPSNTEFFTGPVNAGAPFAFVDGVPASGLACSFLALNDLTDCVDFSSNSGVDWSYIPNGSFDPAVTNVRFRLSGPMNANSGSGSPYFELRFRVRLK